MLQVVENAHAADLESVALSKNVFIFDLPVNIDGFASAVDGCHLLLGDRTFCFLFQEMASVWPYWGPGLYREGGLDWKLALEGELTGSNIKPGRNFVRWSLPTISNLNLKFTDPVSCLEPCLGLIHEYVRPQLAFGGIFGVLKRFLGLVGLPSGGFFGVGSQFTGGAPKQKGEYGKSRSDNEQQERTSRDPSISVSAPLPQSAPPFLRRFVLTAAGVWGGFYVMYLGDRMIEGKNSFLGRILVGLGLILIFVGICLCYVTLFRWSWNWWL
jgi:hypothetical protein